MSRFFVKLGVLLTQAFLEEQEKKRCNPYYNRYKRDDVMGRFFGGNKKIWNFLEEYPPVFRDGSSWALLKLLLLSSELRWSKFAAKCHWLSGPV